MNYQYIKQPNLPTRKACKVIVDYRISEESQKSLEKEGIEVIKTVPISSLYEQVNGHPDMQIHHLGDNNFVCEPSSFSYYKEKLKGANLLKGTELSEKYPYDILYNGALCNYVFFHKLNYTEKEIINFYNHKKVRLVNVNQGYSKCSVAVIADNTIITSDEQIHKKALEFGLNSLYVNPIQIILNGMSNGFIGGVCGLIDKNVLAINGSLNCFDDGRKIKKYCEAYNIKILELQNSKLVDIGSIIPVMQK